MKKWCLLALLCALMIGAATAETVMPTPETTATPGLTATPTPTATPTLTPAPTPTSTPVPTPTPDYDAEDITLLCALNGHVKNQHMDQMRDGSYRTFWEASARNGERTLTITVPEGEKAGGLLIRWRTDPVAVAIQVKNAEDKWENVLTWDGEFHAQYIPLPDLTGEFRIIGRDDPMTHLKICEITIITPGRLPNDFQAWKKPSAPVDLMLLSGHPDDEVLWFGGMIPYYTAQGKQVLVVCAAFNSYHRRLELMDCLWTCGVRVAPVFAGFVDILSNNINTVYNQWGRVRTNDRVAVYYRQYRPKVVVLHDERGEYGHGVHRAFSAAGRNALAVAEDPNKVNGDLGKYEPYTVPKVYIHLWKENQITLDWHQPLDYFGGMTSQNVAREGFKKHVSQQDRGWQVWDGGQWDNALFGLYRSTVGPDVEKNDIFENIE